MYIYVTLYIFFEVQTFLHAKPHGFKPPLHSPCSFLQPNPSAKKSKASRELRKQCRVLQEVVKPARAVALLRDFFWAALYTGPDVICRALIKDLHQVFTQNAGTHTLTPNIQNSPVHAGRCNRSRSIQRIGFSSITEIRFELIRALITLFFCI